MSTGSTRLVPNMCPSLTEEVYNKLQKEGIKTTIQFLTQNLTELASKTDLPEKILQNIAKVLSSFHGSFPISGKDLYQKKLRSSTVLTTGYENFDNIMNGGLRTGEITEIYGASGVGKTTLCLNIALHASVKCNKKVLLVDPLASITSSRAMTSLQKCAESDEISDQCLESLQILTPTTIWELFQVLHRIQHSVHGVDFRNEGSGGSASEDILQTQELLIVDSLSHFIYPLLGDHKDNAYGILNLLEKNLKSVANEKNMAVILVNNSVKKKESDIHAAPALGRMWAHVPHHRVLLEPNLHLSPQVVLSITKSTRLKNSSCSLSL